MSIIKTYEQFINENKSYELFNYVQSLPKLGKGTEGDVYVDDEYAYKVTGIRNLQSDYKKFIGLDLEHIVKIFDVIIEGDDVIIKMEKLVPIDKTNIDIEEFKKTDEALWEMEDDSSQVQYLIKDVKDPEIIKMLETIIAASKELNQQYIDLGFHNMMYDENTKKYKLVDIL